MASLKFKQIKPHVNICTINHIDEGRATLTAAIEKTLAAQVRSNGLCMEYETDTRRYSHVDLLGYYGWVRNVHYQSESAILVVSAADGLPQMRKQIFLARLLGVPYLIVFLDKTNMVDEEELLELVKLEVRELLSFYNFPGDEVPIVVGSALKALEKITANPKTQRSEDPWVNGIYELMDALDSYIPTLPLKVEKVDKPFLMGVEKIFASKGRGTVVVGRIERGQIKDGEAVELVGFNHTRSTTVISVEMCRHALFEGKAGDEVGLLFRDIQKHEVERGMVIAKPGSITPHTTFESEVYVLTEKEGGRQTPFFCGYSPQFYVMPTTDVTGTITSLATDDGSAAEMVIPGDRVNMTVELYNAIAIEPGMRFAIREGDRTIGAGIVSKILK